MNVWLQMIVVGALSESLDADEGPVELACVKLKQRLQLHNIPDNGGTTIKLQVTAVPHTNFIEWDKKVSNIDELGSTIKLRFMVP